MKALIFAAGLGTRLYPLTSTKPKALVEIAGKPLLEWQLLNLHKYGFNDIVINIHSFGNMIKEWVSIFLEKRKELNLTINFSDESDLLRDTGGGIKKAKSLLYDGEPILVHNVDIFSNINLGELYKKVATEIKNDNNGTLSHLATIVVSERTTDRKFLFDKNMKLVGWMNSKLEQIKSPFQEILQTPFNELKNRELFAFPFAGIHIISPDIFKAMEDFGEKFSIVDFYLSIAQAFVIKGENISNLKLFDVGKIEQIKEAEQFIYQLNNINNDKGII